MNDPHTRKCWDCGHVFTCRDGVLPECACRECGSHDTRRQKSQAERDTEAATAAAEARIKACLAACEGVDHLTPGCVAKLVEALERIACSDALNVKHGYTHAGFAGPIAEAALAAMKGV